VIALDAIESARRRIDGAAVRTPLVRLHVDAPAEIWLKLENLQPIASFKIRGAANAVRAAAAADVEAGLVTASAGNMAQGVAWIARELGVPATIVVPEHAPETKLAATERLGATVMRVPYGDWWRAIEQSRFPGVDGLFVHPVSDERVMAGNGTIALEILEDLPEPDAVLVPFGGGGLVTGIASALRALRPETRVYAVEPETGAALNAALAAGTPTEVDYRPSFVDGSGSRRVLPDMWPRVRELIDGAVTASLDEAAAAVRLLAERARIVTEGAGALAPAAALAGRAGEGSLVCVVSGGNIDLSILGTILAGQTPGAARDAIAGSR
jgi:threonine dehydratase